MGAGTRSPGEIGIRMSKELERVWDDMYKSRYGYWRTYVMTVIYRYLDCGDLHRGGAGAVVKNVAMSTSWHFLASAGIFAPPVIRKGLSNMENGC